MATQVADRQWMEAGSSRAVYSAPIVADGEATAPHRYGYAPSRRPRFLAAGAAAALTLLVVAPLVMMHAGHHGQQHRRLATFDFKELKLPPPPSHESHPTHVQRLTTQPVRLPPQPTPPVAQPVVALPAAPVVALTLPAPPAPPAPAVPEVKSVVTIHGDDLTSRLVSAMPPTYPDESRRAHEMGTVLLYLVVGVDGRVEDISIRKSSGSYRLDRAAENAVKRWRWSPTLVNGEPVKLEGVVPIPFVLKS